MMSFRRPIVGLLFSGLWPWASPAAAEPGMLRLLPPVVGSSELFVSHSRSALALNGFDPLTYLLERRPRPGSAGHELVWSGLAWHFVSAANRAAFLRDPDGFAPRFGGYDAEAIARGVLAEADPQFWVRRSGRVYLFRTSAARDRFRADQGVVVQAEARWPALRADLVSH